MNKYLRKCKCLLLPSVLGIAVFYAVPYLRVIYYSFIENQFSRQFVGLENYRKVLSNPYFRLAVKNSLLLIVIAVPILVVAAFVISILLNCMRGHWRLLRIAFVFPMLLPTASIVLVWRTIFAGNESVLPIYCLFWYKNLGVLVILISAAFSTLDESVYEAARLDGAGGMLLHRKITLPLIFPTLLFTVLLGVVYSYKVFRESFLYYGGAYPPDNSYTLQYYMNNHFLKLNYQNLASAAVLTSLLLYVIVWGGVRLARKFAIE